MSIQQFIKPYGQKITAGEHFILEDDTTDQRSPVNNIEDLYNQFVVPMDVMEELESEHVEDFENDFYDYDDRSDLGEDIALAGQIDLEQYIPQKKKESKKKADEAEEKVDEGTAE